MSDVSDLELLRDYARRGSEAAFAEVVQRHIHLVYSAAFRHVGLGAQAEEISQAVFVILARKAAALRAGTVLEAWLYETTRYVSISFLRAERRRQAREQEAYMQSTLQESAIDSAWERLAPMLDEAVGRLGQKDRQAVVLRFLKEKTVGEVAAALGISEAAAQKRVTRAVEKLRRFFVRRGLVVPAAVFVAALSANAIQAAPAVLAKSVTATALAKGAATGSSTSALVKGALKLMAWHKAKMSGAIGAGILCASGSAFLAAGLLGVGAPAPPTMEGAWEGAMTVTFLMPFELHSVLHISRSAGAYQATVDLIELGQKEFPASKFICKNGKVHLELSALASYDGIVNSNATEIVGQVRGEGMEGPLILKRTETPRVVPEPLADSDCVPKSHSPQGHWVAKENIMGMPLQLGLRIAQPPGGRLCAEMDTPDNGLKHIPVMAAEYSQPVVKLMALGGNFEGRLSDNGAEIQGFAGAGPMQIPCIFRRAEGEIPRSFVFTNEADLPGHWSAVLNSSAGKLRLVLNIARLADGKLAATLDSPDQGLSEIQATSITRVPPAYVSVRWTWMGYAFVGKLAGNKLSGTWTSGVAAVPLVFERTRLTRAQ